MSFWLQQTLPHLGAALVVLCLIAALLQCLNASHLVRRLVIGLVAILLFLPVMEYELTHYIRVVTGDLSITGLVMLSLALAKALIPNFNAEQPLRMAPVILLAALLLYPTALGLTWLDIYASGYYPLVIGPLVFALFAICLWFGQRLPAATLAVAFVMFALGTLESDNLWDYLLDPVVAAYSLYLVIRHWKHLPNFRLSQRHIEVSAAIVIASFLVFSIYLSRFNDAAFRFELTLEDGFIEWCTVMVLLGAMGVCIRRFWLLRRARSPLFLSVTALLALLCLFGAGEEISWGQRILDLETPDYLKERNAQGELGLHNLVIDVGGRDVKVNKLIFGTGLALCLTIYLFVATPLYRHQPVVRQFFNRIAAPMPRNFHLAGYLLVLATVELLIDSSKRGEMTEFAGSIIFALNITYPWNPEIFDPKQSLQEIPDQT